MSRWKRAAGGGLILSVDNSAGTLWAVRSLNASGYDTWVMVSEPGTYAERSRAAAGVVHVRDPLTDADGHAHDLAAAAGRLGVAAVLPGTEKSLRSLTGREGMFPPGVAVGTASRKAYDRATDKRLLAELAREAGLETPPTIEVSGVEVDHEQIALPAVVKPLRSVDSAPGSALHQGRVTRVETSAELRTALTAAPEGAARLVQPWIAGTLAAICGVAWRGEIVCAVHQRSPRIWPPRRGITSYAISVPADADRESAVARLVRSMDWSGVFGAQFILAGERAYLIDFNPRIYGSIALAIASGLDLPTIWADLLLGRPVSPGGYRSGVRYRVEEDDYRALWWAFRRGERAAALRGLVPRRRTVHGVASLRDPAPLLVSGRKLGEALLSRLRRGG